MEWVQVAVTGSDAALVTMEDNGCQNLWLHGFSTCSGHLSISSAVRELDATLEARDPFGGVFTMPITHTGIEPGKIRMEPAVLDLGQVSLRGLPVTGEVTVFNDSDMWVSTDGWDFSGPRVGLGAAAMCWPRVEPGASCSVRYTFTPTVLGEFSTVHHVVDASAQIRALVVAP